MECKMLKKRKCEITQYYNPNHSAIDVVGENYTLDDIICHTSGKVIDVQDGLSNMKGSIGRIAYGNFIKIEHQDEYQTLYAHMKSGLNYKIGDYINEGDFLGEMGDSGNAYGAHLHFEIWKNNIRINPLEYLNKNLPTTQELYNVGDTVEINGVYISSTSNNKQKPLIKIGIITKIISNSNNPYLLNNGEIGWVNNQTIIRKIEDKFLSNKTYQGSSIVDALKEINIDSSYEYRKKLATLNNINDYKGTATQNTQLLNLLKKGFLKY